MQMVEYTVFARDSNEQIDTIKSPRPPVWEHPYGETERLQFWNEQDQEVRGSYCAGGVGRVVETATGKVIKERY